MPSGSQAYLLAGGIFLAGGLAGVAVERLWLGGRREERRRQRQAQAQLAALERMVESLDDEFGDAVSFTGAELNQQLLRVHTQVDTLLLWVEAVRANEFPGLQHEWKELQHKVHKLSLEIQRFQSKPNHPAKPAGPKQCYLLEHSGSPGVPEPAAGAEGAGGAVAGGGDTQPAAAAASVSP